jgi:hypothetical protein
VWLPPVTNMLVALVSPAWVTSGPSRSSSAMLLASKPSEIWRMSVTSPTDRMPALARRAIAAACSNPDWALAILGLAAHYGRVAATTISETRCISSSAASGLIGDLSTSRR